MRHDLNPTPAHVRETVNLLRGTMIRIGKFRLHGPTFVLARYDYSRKMFTVRSVATGVESTITLDELTTGVREGIVHLMKGLVLPPCES